MLAMNNLKVILLFWLELAITMPIQKTPGAIEDRRGWTLRVKQSKYHQPDE